MFRFSSLLSRKFKQPLFRFSSLESKEELVKICALLNIKYQPINSEIPAEGKIKLIDGVTGQFYGIYERDDAM